MIRRGETRGSFLGALVTSLAIVTRVRRRANANNARIRERYRAAQNPPVAILARRALRWHSHPGTLKLNRWETICRIETCCSVEPAGGTRRRKKNREWSAHTLEIDRAGPQNGGVLTKSIARSIHRYSCIARQSCVEDRRARLSIRLFDCKQSRAIPRVLSRVRVSRFRSSAGYSPGGV